MSAPVPFSIDSRDSFSEPASDSLSYHDIEQAIESTRLAAIAFLRGLPPSLVSSKFQRIEMLKRVAELHRVFLCFVIRWRKFVPHRILCAAAMRCDLLQLLRHFFNVVSFLSAFRFPLRL